MSDSGTNERRGKGFAGLDSMVSDVSEDIGRAAAASVESASIPTDAASPVVEGAERQRTSIPANPAAAGFPVGEERLHPVDHQNGRGILHRLLKHLGHLAAGLVDVGAGNG